MALAVTVEMMIDINNGRHAEIVIADHHAIDIELVQHRHHMFPFRH